MRKKKKRPDEVTSYWRSYSDMMAALLLMFILLMALALFQFATNGNEISESEGEYEEAKYKDELEEDEEDFDLEKAIEEEDWDSLEEYFQEMTEDNEDRDARYSDLDDMYLILIDKLRELGNEVVLLQEVYDELSSAAGAMESKAAAYDAQMEQLDTLIGIRSSIIEQLSDTFKEKDMTVEVDQQTGAIILAANLLFDYDNYKLKEDAKDFLDEFLEAYFSVILDREYLPYISEIIIEGHTDHAGSYLYNLNLSQKRAYSIAEYCFADRNNHFTETELDDIRSLVTANGRSWSQLIYNEDGTENSVASRRVEIKFRLVDEDMIDEMKGILEE